MKLSSILPLVATSLIFAVASAADADVNFYSEDWDLSAEAAAAAAETAPSTSSLTALAESTTSLPATSPPSPAPWFDWTRLVKSGPIYHLLTRAGVNITQHLDAVAQRVNEKPWDPSIPMITDENWEHMVLNEPLSPEEEQDRTWFMVVTLGAAADPLSKYVDKEFDGAYNISLIKQDLPNVRFGRIDYLTVTRLTTCWFVWKAPIFVVAHNRGRVLRFLRHNEIRVDAENLHKFLSLGAWTEIPPWDGPFAPGGDLEKYVEIFAIWLTKFYNLISRIPKWFFLVASGSIGSLLIQAMHSWGQKKEKTSKRYVVKSARAVLSLPAASVPAASAPVATAPGTTTASASPTKTRSEGSPSGGKRRKNARR